MLCCPALISFQCFEVIAWGVSGPSLCCIAKPSKMKIPVESKVLTADDRTFAAHDQLFTAGG